MGKGWIDPFDPVGQWEIFNKVAKSRYAERFMDRIFQHAPWYLPGGYGQPSKKNPTASGRKPKTGAPVPWRPRPPPKLPQKKRKKPKPVPIPPVDPPRDPEKPKRDRNVNVSIHMTQNSEDKFLKTDPWKYD